MVEVFCAQRREPRRWQEKKPQRERDSPSSEQMVQQHPERDGVREPGDAAFIPKCIKEKKYTLAAAGVITILVITIIALAAKKPEPCQRCPPPVDAACPDRWVGYQGKCYYISGDRRNWSESETRCSGFGASLALIDSQLDLGFLINLTRPYHYWIGLSRDEGKAWRWTNGTELNNLFVVRGEGQCAYIDDNGLSSTWCFMEKNFLCSQRDAYSRRRNLNLTQRDPSSTSI